MTPWEIRLDPDEAAPVLATLPPPVRKRMRAALRSLSDDPAGVVQDLDIRRLRTDGPESFHRLRIGAWRAVFIVRPGRVDVMRIFRRDEGYGWLDRLDGPQP